MGAYEYHALDRQGRTVKGVLQGDADRHIRTQLREQGLTPLQVEPVHDRADGARPAYRLPRRRLSRSALALLTRQFATLAQAGLTVDECLRALADQTESARTRVILEGVRARVLEGQTLAQALGGFPIAFPDLYRNMIAAAEQSGQLDHVLERLADYTEERQALQEKVVLAFVYPALVVTVALLAVTGLMIYVVPQVTRVFVNSGQSLPWLTQALITTSELLKNYGIYLLVAITGAAFGFRLALRQAPIRLRWHRFVLRLPVIGRMVRGLNAERIASTLGILTASGIPLLGAMQSSVQITNNLPMRAAMESAVKAVREGGSLSRALARSALFPPLIVHLIASGEATGQLDRMLTRAATAQARELEIRVRVFAAILEPALLVFTGVIVLVIVLAILLPILRMNQLVL